MEPHHFGIEGLVTVNLVALRTAKTTPSHRDAKTPSDQVKCEKSDYFFTLGVLASLWLGVGSELL